MLVQICLFSSLTEGLLLPIADDVSRPLPERWKAFSPLCGEPWDSLVFTSFHEFMGSLNDDAPVDLNVWFRADHVVSEDDFYSCLQVHQSAGATATSFHAKLIPSEDSSDLLTDIPAELLAGWENPSFSCFAGGKYACPITPLVIEGVWLNRFASWLMPRFSPADSALVGFTDFISACMGQRMRVEGKKLRLTTQPELRLHLPSALESNFDLRRRALIRGLCLKAVDHHNLTRRQKSRSPRLLTKLAQDGWRKLMSLCVNAEELLIPGLSGDYDHAHLPQDQAQELRAIERYVRDMSASQLAMALKLVHQAGAFPFTVWKAKIQIG